MSVLNDRKFRMGIAVACFLLVNQLLVVVIKAPPPADPVDIEYVRDYVPEDTVVMGLPDIYHYLLKYDRFLSYHSGERYGIELRNEDYPTFWERERPQVFVGEPEPDDDEWWTYMHAHDFRHVRDTVWVEASLLEAISADVPAPEFTFVADQTHMDFGDCVELEWSVSRADRVELDEEAVGLIGTERVCPHYTTGYTLSVYWVGGVQEETINVSVK